MEEPNTAILLAKCNDCHKSDNAIVNAIQSSDGKIFVSRSNVYFGKQYCLAIYVKTTDPAKVRSVLAKIKKHPKVSAATTLAKLTPNNNNIIAKTSDVYVEKKLDTAILLAKCKGSHESHDAIIKAIKSSKDRITMFPANTHYGKQYCLTVFIKKPNSDKIRTVLAKIRKHPKVSAATILSELT